MRCDKKMVPQSTRAVQGIALAATLFFNQSPWALAADTHSPRQMAQKIFVVHISPPQSGVKLIEEVFQRVRSSPEIAMRTNWARQKELQTLTKQNDKLAIRPPQAGQVVLQPSPSLQLLAQQGPHAQSVTTSVRGRLHSASAGPVLNSALAAKPAAASSVDGAKIAEAASPVDAWMGSRRIANEDVWAQKQNFGLWDRKSEEREAADAVKEAKDLEAPLVVGGLGGGGGQSMSGSAGAAQNEYVNGVAAPSEARSAGGAYSASKLDVNQQNNAPKNLPLAIAKMVALGNAIDRATTGDATALRTSETDALKKVESASCGGAPRPSASPEAAAAPHQSRAAKKTLRRVPVAFVPSDSVESVGYKIKSKEHSLPPIAMHDASIAVLPPNVITGIPLVRLGIPESQANSVLNAMGTTREQKVDNWMVMSWQKKEAKSQTALQLYVRNGLLDAMRIFDPSLLGPEFGINISDGLTRVKEKFGEPAFILNEPGPGAGKNYIYPISQVGFQLVPGQPGEEPRVASVLIFNVK